MLTFPKHLPPADWDKLPWREHAHDTNINGFWTEPFGDRIKVVVLSHILVHIYRGKQVLIKTNVDTRIWLMEMGYVKESSNEQVG